ncbi:MAG: hypothetical protein A2039_05180 [Candidatus Melainabacteria bacterium GWA2_34_9]|nr:MAG: hypothetical protein A2039_05180 [Candidatus Melainabacteria bacterium GWA2_34_9]
MNPKVTKSVTAKLPKFEPIGGGNVDREMDTSLSKDKERQLKTLDIDTLSLSNILQEERNEEYEVFYKKKGEEKPVVKKEIIKTANLQVLNEFKEDNWHENVEFFEWLKNLKDSLTEEKKLNFDKEFVYSAKESLIKHYEKNLPAYGVNKNWYYKTLRSSLLKRLSWLDKKEEEED